MHHYTVDSDFGKFDVTGDSALRKLLREIDAIAKLHEVKKTKVYWDALKESGKRPLHFGKNMITHPVDTVSGTVKGVGTLFGNIKEGITETVHGTSDPSADNKAKQILQVATYKREWAYKLGVDPYSSNKALQKELNGVGWAGRPGRLKYNRYHFTGNSSSSRSSTVWCASPTRLEEVDEEQRKAYVDQINKMVEELPPTRMRLANEEKLAEMGIADELAKQYLDSPHFTPRHDAIIVDSLASLKGAKGREIFFSDGPLRSKRGRRRLFPKHG